MSDAILIPIALDAEVVGDADAIVPPPHTGACFGDGAAALEPGVHLHWALPDGLCRGTVDNDGKLRFPALPDQWVVVRFGPDTEPDGRRAAHAFLVDAWNETVAPLAAATFPEPSPDRPLLTAAGKLPDGVLEEQTAPSGWEIAPAYYQASRRRFGFHDTPDLSIGSVSYLVAGYYASEAEDPIASAFFPDLRARELGFAVEGVPTMQSFPAIVAPLGAEQPPAFTIAIRPPRVPVDHVDFAGRGELPAPLREAQAREQTMEILRAGIERSRGAREARAHAAQIAARGLDVARAALGGLPSVGSSGSAPSGAPSGWILCHGALFDVGGLIATPAFKSMIDLKKTKTGGPTLFAAATMSEGAERAFADLGGPQGARLLAVLQQGLAVDFAKGESVRTVADKLYDAGFLAEPAPSVTVYTAYAYDQGDPRAAAGVPETVLPDGASLYVRDRRRVPGADLPYGVPRSGLGALRATLAAANPLATLAIEQSTEPAPRFYQRGAPAAILRGAGRSYRHGEDGRFDQEGLLRCRRGHEIIHAVSQVSTSGSIVTVGADQVVHPALRRLALTAVASLVGEAALLDPLNAPRLAALTGAAPGAEKKLVPDAPPPVMAAATWHAAFAPVFAECAYAFTPAGGGGALDLTERGVLSPVISGTLTSTINNLHEILRGGADEPTLAKAAESMFKLDLLSFTLPGLRSALVAAGQVIREGSLTITKARVIDTFGKVLDLALDPAKTTVPLPRAFTAPARLSCRFVDASTAPAASLPDAGPLVSPVAGYLLPDPIERALEVYDHQGEHLGQLRHEDTNGPSVSAEGPPGDTATFGAAVSSSRPALRQITQDLRAAPGVKDTESRVSALIRVIDTTRLTTRGVVIASDYNETLSGRPVVLLRARLLLEGPPGATAQVSLGCISQLDDGLLGYFAYDAALGAWSGLRVVHPVVLSRTVSIGGLDLPSDEGMADNNLRRIGSAWVTVDDSGLGLTTGTPVDLLLLLDGRLGFNVLADELPRKYLRAPEVLGDKVLKLLSLCLRAGPVLTDPAAFSVPAPPLSDTTIRWIRRGKDGPEEVEIGPHGRSVGALPDKLMFVEEGWLSLRRGKG